MRHAFIRFTRFRVVPRSRALRLLALEALGAERGCTRARKLRPHLDAALRSDELEVDGCLLEGAFGTNGGLRFQALLKAPRHQRSGRKGPQREGGIERESGGS